MGVVGGGGVVLAEAIGVFVPRYNLRTATLHRAGALKITNTNTDIMYKATLIHFVHGENHIRGHHIAEYHHWP